MPILSYCTTPEGLFVDTGDGRLAITPRTSRCIRIRYSLEREFSSRPSLMVLPGGHAAGGAPAFTVSEDREKLTFSTDDVAITIDRQTAVFAYYGSDGVLLTREPGRGGKTLEPIDVIVSQFDGEEVELTPSVDGLRMQARDFREVVDRQAYHAKLEFQWADGEALYGLGSHEEGMLNLRGQHQYLYQQNMKAVVPTLVSTRGYGVLFDAYSLMIFHDDASGTAVALPDGAMPALAGEAGNSYLWMDVAAELDYYFVYGPEFDGIVRELRELTGQAPMLPRWAFGYIQSKERYVNQAELVDVVREYRARQLPLDCIVLDWKSWPGDLWGQKSFDPERFADPDGMAAELHQLDAKLMISIWPIMRPGGANWTAMREHGFLLGNQATYNAFDAGARALYWQQAHDGLWRHGVDAWWCDCTEPFEADWQGAVKPEPEERMLINTGEAKRYLDPEFINAYSLLHSQGIYEGQRAAAPERRVVNLTRSSYMGQHRYGTVTWSGDVSATWNTLRRQIAEGLNFCVTGEPYWTTDVGGFFVQRKPGLWFWNGDFDAGGGGPGVPGAVRALVPVRRVPADVPLARDGHAAEIWRFGEPGDPPYDALVKALHLRYRLLPYIYSLAGWTTQRGYTMLRNLAFDFRHDPAAYNRGDEFMFGPAFLVAPVTQPMVYGPGGTPVETAPGTREVYLPATPRVETTKRPERSETASTDAAGSEPEAHPGSTEWYDFWTGEGYAGGQAVTAAAPLDTMPLFVRAGSIVPLGPGVQHSAETADAPLEIQIYAGRDAAFDLYEDEGDGYNYELGAFAITPLRWQDASRRLVIEARTGSYAGMPLRRKFMAVLHAPGARVERRTAVYDGGRIVVQF